MEKLEIAVKQREGRFIAEVQAIQSSNCSDRIKIAKFYHAYVACMANINTLVSDAKLEPQQAGSASA